MFLGRLHPVKGLPNLIDAWNNVRPKNWKLIIAGPLKGTYTKKIYRKVQKSGFAEKIVFQGSVTGNKKADLLLQTELFILPSLSESFGVAIGEALSYGIPVITTKATPWQAIRDVKCGWWIDPGVKSLERTIRAATSLSSSELFEMGIRGREFIDREFAWRKITRKTELLYNWVKYGGHKPDFIYD